MKQYTIPIYADVIDLAMNGLNAKNAILDQLAQGDPILEEIAEEIREECGEECSQRDEDFYSEPYAMNVPLSVVRQLAGHFTLKEKELEENRFNEEQVDEEIERER